MIHVSLLYVLVCTKLIVLQFIFNQYLLSCKYFNLVRTHQLRVHCAALGHAIVADPTYGIYGEAAPNGGFISNLFYENRKMVEDINSKVQEKQQTMCLHAKSLEFRHPVSGKQMIIDANPPF